MITWNPALETGHAVIDRDHRALVNSLNELEAALQAGAGKQEVERILQFLNAYTREHFKREEAYMLRVNCPASGENCRAHSEFLQKLDVWTKQLTSTGITTTLVLTVFRETSRWVQGHILKVDCKLRSCQPSAVGATAA